MNKHVAFKLMDTIEKVLNYIPDNSIFKKNINPIRVSLMLYRLIDEI
jgi:hypothetical protein